MQAGDHRVDVIIPTRNRPLLTLEAIDSVLAQTFRSWHLWVVDDASDDDTPRCVERHVAGDARVTVLHRTTRGRANPARQTALDASTAPLVATCDSDDLWEPDKLARQVAAYDEALERTATVGPVVCWHDAVDEHGVRRGPVLRPQRRRWWHPFNQFNTSTPLVARHLLDAVGGFAPGPDYPWRTTDHLELFLRLTRHHSLVVVPELLVHCRHHPGPRNSDGEHNDAAAEESSRLAAAIDADLVDRPATRAWVHASVAGRYFEADEHRTAAGHLARALRVGGPVTSAAILAHYGPWLARRAARRRPAGGPR